MISGIEYKKKFHSIWDKYLLVNHGGINYGRILAYELSLFCHSDNPYGLKDNFKKLVRNLLYTQDKYPYYIENHLDKSFKDVLFLHEEEGRRDYQLQCEFVLRAIVDFSIREIKVDTKFSPNKGFFSVRRFFEKICLLAKLVWYVNPFESFFVHENQQKILYFYSKCLLYSDFVNILERNNSIWHTRLLVVFYDMKTYSNILVQVARKKGVKSATLQHGMYIELSDDAYAISAINYKNFTADYLLAWGESLKDIWRNTKLRNDQYIVAGCNLKEMVTNVGNTVQQLPEKEKFGVLLSAEHRRISNMKMLEIAQELSTRFKMDYEILFHPANDQASYLKDNKFTPAACFKQLSSVGVFVADKTFLICHTTTAYFSALSNLRKCYRFKDDRFFDMGGMSDIFSNIEELDHFISKKDYIITLDDIKEINKVLSYHFGSENESYKKAIQKLLNN